jgi:hypothetical protein
VDETVRLVNGWLDKNRHPVVSTQAVPTAA